MIPTLQLAGRGNAIATPTAPIFDRSILRVIGDGAGASFVDRSPSASTITANGNATNSSTVVGSGAWSVILDGTGDYLSVPDSTDWNAGDSMTWEGLFYWDEAALTVNRYFPLLAQSSSGSGIRTLAIFADNAAHGYPYYFDRKSTGVSVTVQGASTVLPQTVYHVALTAQGPGAPVRLHLAGSLVATVTDFLSPDDLTSALLIGGYSDGGSYFSGRDAIGRLKVRASNWARYSRASFTPPTDFAVDDPAAPSTSTWNPSDKGASIVLRGSNYVMSATATTQSVRGTVGRSATDHRYCEIIIGGPDAVALVGLGNSSATLSLYPGGDTNGWAVYCGDGHKYTNNADGGATGIGAYSAGDVVGLELDNGTLRANRNGGTFQTVATGLTGTLYPMIGAGSGSGGPRTGILNVGQRAWDGSLPSGASAWG